MPVEESLLRVGMEAAAAVCIPVTGWFVKAHSDRLRKIEADTLKAHTEMAEHKVDAERYKLEAEQRFAKDVVIQATLARLHERVDDIGIDVKTILRRSSEGGNG